MSSSATLVQLAAELTAFVVAVAGVGLSVRAGLLGLDRVSRWLLASGFALMGASAFAVGALVVERGTDALPLAAVRVAAALIVAMGALRWAGSRLARPLLLAGLVVFASAAVIDLRGVDLGPERIGAEPLVAVAAALMGGALVIAGRRSIPGRIVTSVAGALLAVILLVSFSLSAVISRALEDEANRMGGPETGLVVEGAEPAAGLVETREDLYRSLFVVVMVAGLLGVALAVVVGERIGGAITGLTATAKRIREGDLDARAEIDREDELGELSSTFDSMALSLRDLTDDLRDAATEEGRLRARLESVFDSVTEAVVAVDAGGFLTGINPAARRLLGVGDHQPVAGSPLAEVLDLRGPDGHRLTPSAPRDQPRMVAGQVHPPSEPPVPVLGTVATLRTTSDGGTRRIGMVVVLRDVRREQALESAKQDFLANIGHELRTPLTPIKGYAGVLRRRTPTPEQAREWGEGISAGVERLERMVDRLVTFAAVTAGPAGDNRSVDPVDLTDVVDQVVDAWAPRVQPERDLTVEVHARGTRVMGDLDHLRLALGELVDNADRFSVTGGRITVSVGLVADPGSDVDQVAVTVRDAGGGDSESIELLTAAFVQGEASSTRRHEGLGLGLALAERVARAHGGRLVTDPSPMGTAVSILLPAVATGSGDPWGLDPFEP